MTLALSPNPFLLAFTLGVVASPLAGNTVAGAAASTPGEAGFTADARQFLSELPVLVLDTFGSGALVKDGRDHPSTLRVFSAGQAAATFSRDPQLTTHATLSVRGSSSAEFPKKSFTLTLRNEQGKKAAQPLLGLPAAETWVLVAPWSFDPGFINNAFVYELSNRLGRWAPRTRFVEVFLNPEGGPVTRAHYAGIYVLIDRIESGENRVALSPTGRNTAAADSGYLFKIDAADADEFSWSIARGIGSATSSIMLVSPKADHATTAQQAFIRDHVQRMENALHADDAGGWAQRTHLEFIDRAAWIDHHLLNTFVCNPDALVRSAYFTKDPAGRIAAGPVWDFDRALGSYWDERSHRWDVWSGLGGTDVWNTGWWGVLARDPEFIQSWIDRWQTLRQSQLADVALAALVSALGRSVTAGAAARDAIRWPDNASPYGSHAEQLDYLRRWLLQRAGWIDEQFVPPPVVNANGATVTFTPPPGADLVFTIDGSDPRSTGGGIAPTAEITSRPLQVAAAANVHVRCYRPDQTCFPGSRWSSVVATAAASPLYPRARLVNLSSRAVVGPADQAMIVGVAVKDTTSKRILARAAGPALANFGVTNYAPHPVLLVFAGTQELVRNRGWETAVGSGALPAHAKSVGAFPFAPGSADSALAHAVTGAGCMFQITSDHSHGTALAELYESGELGEIANVSTRATLRGTGRTLVSGFVIRGPAYQRLLIRAVGPTLHRFGIADALADPIVNLFRGADLVARNDQWAAAPNLPAIAKASSAVGAFSLDPQSADAALLLTLRPGAYTVEVNGVDGSEGVVLLEISDVP